MNDAADDIARLVDHLFRREAGKLVAILTRIFGSANIELAEDIVQDTLLAALNHWSVGTVPDNPAAWLTQVAKRKAFNELQRRKTAAAHRERQDASAATNSVSLDEIFLEREIPDSQLRMIFTCCHPALSLPSQIALTLKTLCGFGVSEVARALLSSESTINKRLYRAKQKIRRKEIPFSIPSGPMLEERLDAVCLTLYLLFNEGYTSSHRESVIRRELCIEAMRLTRLLLEHFEDYPRLFALIALMCFHAARFEARIDQNGAIVIFEDQNRDLWDQKLIAAGMRYLGQAARGGQLSEYHLEAGIAAEHCLAGSFAMTNWQSVYQQYELLYRLKPNPIIRLNMAIIRGQIDGAAAALPGLAELADDRELQSYFPLPVTQGIFAMKTHDFASAREFFRRAQTLTQSQRELDFLKIKLGECELALAAGQV